MSQIKKILIVGLGSIGNRYVRIISESYPNIKIMVLRHKKCTNVSKLYECVAEVNKAIEFKPDAAILANPASKHIGIAIKLAEKRIHLLVEKPISDTVLGVQELIALCHNNGVTLMTAYNLRFSPSLIRFREEIIKHKIGNIISIRSEVGQYLPNWRPNSDYKKSVSAQKILGGGVLLELSHEIDYLYWIFGDVEWVKSHLSRQSSLEIDVEDVSSNIIGFKDGKLPGSQLIATLNLDFIRHDTTRQCVAIGDNGSLRWDGISEEVSYFPKNGKKWGIIFDCCTSRDYTYIKEVEHFFNSIEFRKTPLISGEDGLKVLKIVEAARKSNNNGSIANVKESF